MKKSRRRKHPAPRRTWLSRPEEHRNTQARSGETDSMVNLVLSVLTQREKESRLPHLTPEKAADLYEDFLQGNLAEVQMCWEQMEDYDSTLSTCLHARQSALADMSWRIEPDEQLLADGNNLDDLAARQTALLTARLRAVDNLEEALVHLGMADFRGVAALEITGNNSRQRWCVIEPWNLVRPLRRGPWFFNKNADPVCPFPEILLEDRVIIREARPMDLAAMFLVMSKTHALQGWDGFLDIYGLPSIFAETPPSIPEERRAEFDAVVQRIVGDGRGTVPAGTKFQTVETTKDNAQAFEQRAKWCDDAIIKLVLGGLLTVQAESGSGTLAGNAHADSFDRLCAASARSISRAVDTQFCRPILKAAFPDQPILVHFVFGDEEQEDHEANAQLLAVAKQAGWQPDAETASQLLGWDAQPAPEPAPAAAPSPMPLVQNRTAGAQDSQIVPSTSYIVNQEAAPLSPEELAAINSLANGGLNQQQIAQDAASAASALVDAVANSDPEDDECHAKDPAHCPHHHPEVHAAKKALDEKMKSIKKMTFQNEHIPGGFSVHKRFKSEIKSAPRIHNSQSALKRAGIKDPDQQTRIHMEQAAMVDKLLARAGKPREEEPKHGADKREKAWHFTAPCNVEGATRPILADITVIKFKNKTKPELYSFYLKTGKAPSLERTSS